ncbi:MAG: 23S rRNA (pseudouridine(1915)-N(3))-methyltransferase RlmH [Acholeplasmataceae bacterium]|jgi:23S rRNA (pseudouridine1915-N3)-methyltransferase|nr:23S rRNA (pseudouridine(1915)-N(3))-methyltransferase RlmH [Acholeplasmataceae bacterium]
MKIIAIGKNKKKFVNEGIQFYQKQISKLEIIELKQSNPTEEGKLILKSLKSDDYVILLDVSSKTINSIEFARLLADIKNKTSQIVFLIGGSKGFSEEVKQIADQKISFSKMTFPHELFRLILVEQIYRAESINNNSPYHK